MGGLQQPVLQETSSFEVSNGKFVQILHVRGNHWCVVSNVGCEENFINVYDTYFSSVSEDTLHVIARILSSSATTITVRMMKVEKQANLSDCGVLAIAIAHEICSGRNPGTVIFNRSELRLHLAVCFQAF